MTENTNYFSAYIFARGGSKGIKNKNIINLNGIPLIEHTINHAFKSLYIRDVFVSTDDKKIKKLSLELGANVIDRPFDLSSDNSPELEAWKHAINLNKKLLKNKPFISLPVTSPLRDFKKIDKAIDLFLSGNYDLVLGASESSRNPYLNMAKENKDGSLEMLNKNNFHYRRQDIPKVYDISTNFYISSSEYILNCKNITEGRIGYVEIAKYEAIDIDEVYDLHLAELLLRYPYES